MTTAMDKPHRDTIFLEDARVISHEAFAGDQFILQVYAPECASKARPGCFAHIRCDRDIPMRRPLSIMRADPATGEVEFLYKIVGTGLAALSRIEVGDEVSMLGPIGNGFSPNPGLPNKLMLGGGVGMPPMVYLAEQLQKNGADLSNSLVVLGSEVPFPFEPMVSGQPVTGLPDMASHAMPALEFNHIPSRLASLQGYDGCFSGYVTDLAKTWLDAAATPPETTTEVFACGPEPMLEAAARLAHDYGLECQLCLEEYMACAVGGCAGCTVPVYTGGAMAMKRVCVDGPVFGAENIYPSL